MSVTVTQPATAPVNVKIVAELEALRNRTDVDIAIENGYAIWEEYQAVLKQEIEKARRKWQEDTSEEEAKDLQGARHNKHRLKPNESFPISIAMIQKSAVTQVRRLKSSTALGNTEQGHRAHKGGLMPKKPSVTHWIVAWDPGELGHSSTTESGRHGHRGGRAFEKTIGYRSLPYIVF